MIVQFYKPNKSVKGCAISFDVNVSKGYEGFYIGLVRQSAWNEQTKTGSFKDGLKMTVKMNENEMCSIAHAIETNTAFSTVHKSDSGTTGINFGPYMKEGKQIGYSFSVKRGEESFLFGLSFGEGKFLATFVDWGCKKILDSVFEERSANFKAKNA